MTTPAATQDIYQAFRKLVKRSEDINKAYQNRSDHLVLSDLREGKAVIVAREFKGLDQEWQPGQEFTCNLMDIQRVAFILENVGRVLVTKQEYTDRQEWSALKPIIEGLRPMIEAARNYKDQALQAQGEKQRAEEAVKHWAGELQAAQANLKRTEASAAEYIAGLDLEI
jgi:hypothetical protein